MRPAEMWFDVGPTSLLCTWNQIKKQLSQKKNKADVNTQSRPIATVDFESLHKHYGMVLKTVITWDQETNGIRELEIATKDENKTDILHVIRNLIF